MIIGEPIPTKGMVTRQMDELSARVWKMMSDIYNSRSALAECHPERGRAEQSVSDSGDPLGRDNSLVG
jgi:hypothetical protein